MTEGCGILMMVAGLLLRYTVNRRRFNRRAITGLQGFSSYEHAWLTVCLERMVKKIGLLFIITGAFLCWVGYESTRTRHGFQQQQQGQHTNMK